MVPMEKISTLIFLVNQIQSDINLSGVIRYPDPESESADQKTGNNFAPPERALKRIFDFARAYEVTDTQTVGKVEWIMN